jgi:GTP-binding protein LepA
VPTLVMPMNTNNIRNIVIIAHIDHGKSTLADRMLEITETVPKEKMKEQLLDTMDIERERGITIKLQPVQMHYQGYQLNLIDTPGHVDFTYEVSRSLAAVEGAILLVDSTQGIEAQTLSNAYLALEQDLVLIPAINKIDLPNAQVEKTQEDLKKAFGFRNEEILLVSGKEGTNVDHLLSKVIELVPPPKSTSSDFRALIFDSSFDPFKGVLAYCRVIDGQVSGNDEIVALGTKAHAKVLEVGVFNPSLKVQPSLQAGQIGYIATGLKEVSYVRVGDTLAKKGASVQPLQGYREVKPMVFAGIYPVENDRFPELREALEKLKLNDAALQFTPENSLALGFGFRVGFLGLLHMEIVQERLEREYNLQLITSAPTVEYQVTTTAEEKLVVDSPAQLPKKELIREMHEPWVRGKILIPGHYLGSIMQLVVDHRGVVGDVDYLGERAQVSLEIPLAEIITNFYDQLKSATSGYGSFDYELLENRLVKAEKLDILVAGEPVDALSQIVISSKAQSYGRELVIKLKDVIPRQNFSVALQASIGGKIVARDDIPAFRKDVLAKMSGGHRERKDKLLEAQKKGKKRLKRFGRVEIPQEAFMTVMKS